MVSLHIHTWVNPNNGLGENVKEFLNQLENILKFKCAGHIKSICWSMNNCCKWKESDKLEGTSEGWSGRKLGLIAGGRLTEHLSPPPYPHLKKVYTISAGLPHTIMISPGIRHALKYSLVMGGFSCGIVSRQIATDKILNINAHRIYLYKLTDWSWAANTPDYEYFH